jgi:hypothetical protein
MQDLKWLDFQRAAGSLYPLVPLGARKWPFEAQDKSFEAQGKQGKDLEERGESDSAGRGGRSGKDEWREGGGAKYANTENCEVNA